MLHLSQAAPAQTLFVDNTPTFIEVAQTLGVQGIVHTDYPSTRAALAGFGLQTDDEALHEAA